MHSNIFARPALGIALLLGTAAIAVAQTPAAPPVQTTLAAMVPAGDATHIAMLGRNGGALAAPVAGAPAAPALASGTAWFKLDPQNNTVTWTIEYAGLTPTSAGILCTPAAAPAGTPIQVAAAGANTLDLAVDGRVTSPLQGDTAGVDPALFALLEGGRCMLIMDVGPGPGAIRGAIRMVPAPIATPAA